MLRSLPAGEERRDLALPDAGVSVSPIEAGPQRFSGHAAVFNTRAAIGNPRTMGFYESIAPGAFSKTLGEADARFLIDHSSYHVVSRATAGTLDLQQNTRGLLADSALDTRLSYVNDLIANLDNKNIRGMSFGFQVVKDEWAEEEERSSSGEPAKVEVRTIREVKLIEVSAVTFPAYEGTDAGLRFSLVPALRRRGDVDAIARAVHHRPELAPLLGYDPELAPTTIDLHVNSEKLADLVARKIEENTELLGEMLGNDTPIVADGGAMEPFEERDPKEPYGNVTYADPGYQKDGKKRYPLDSESHCRAAWSYINMPKNAAEYTPEQLASIKSKIKAALKKYGVDVSDESKSTGEPGETTQQVDARENDGTEPTEPAASTREFEFQQQQAKAKAVALAHRLNAA